jgi:intracellular sulfur oxidation DsrE/DsrF family protein
LRLQLTRHTDFFVAADKGGAVRIAELQSQGYLYLRP